MEATTAEMVNEQLESANGQDVEVIINSGGGDVYAGSEIYTALKDYNGKVTVKIVGVAASAASVIAMAGDRVLISPTAQIMIHNVASGVRGDYRAHEHEAEVLKNYNKSIANAYILKSGMSEETLLELMNKETWFTAQQSVEHNLADEVMFDEGAAPKLVASFNNHQMIPQAVIEKMRNEILQNKQKEEEEQEIEPVINYSSVPLDIFEKKLRLNERGIHL